MFFNPRFEQCRRSHAVNYQHDIVADKDCRYEEILMGIISADYAVEQSATAGVKPYADAVG